MSSVRSGAGRRAVRAPQRAPGSREAPAPATPSRPNDRERAWRASTNADKKIDRRTFLKGGAVAGGLLTRRGRSRSPVAATLQQRGANAPARAPAPQPAARVAAAPAAANGNRTSS